MENKMAPPRSEHSFSLLKIFMILFAACFGYGWFIYKNIYVIEGSRLNVAGFPSTGFVEPGFGPSKCALLRLSGPLKKQYALEHGIDFERLLDASSYKEKYRADMIRWGEEKRNKDHGFFCRLATTGEGSEKEIWIISDARRVSDVEFFQKNYGDIALSVRVEADVQVRQDRGFVHTEGIDDAESECGLDHGVDWDVVITNNGDQQLFDEGINKIMNLVTSKVV